MLSEYSLCIGFYGEKKIFMKKDDRNLDGLLESVDNPKPQC